MDTTPSSGAAGTYTTLPDRRLHGRDRRRAPRGGRRASDVIRLAAIAALVTLAGAAAAPAASAQTPGAWSTSGTRIVTPAGNDFVITGINWYGFETPIFVAHGLWGTDYKFILDQAKQYGYNTIRLPFSNEIWETNPFPAAGQASGCPSCTGKRARDIMAMIVNYAGSIGLHVILDNHRSNAGSSAQESGLWYTAAYPEQAWIRDWISVQAWVHGIPQSLGAADTVTVNRFAADGFPTVIGFDLRNEPHSPAAYAGAATWGTGDGIDPAINPNPNPFAPACVLTSTCRDWRLAAQRAANTILGEADRSGWDYPLIFVEGVSLYPRAGGNAASGPYDSYWWGGNLLGINGNATNAGAPVVLNSGGDAAALGAPVYGQVVYSAHEYGPREYAQSWFNATTCYASGCSASSLTDLWTKFWAHVATPGGINPVWPGHTGYPWSNTGHQPITEAPIYIGEFGTGNLDNDLFTTGAGSQGQWMTSFVNFIASSYDATKSPLNDSGVAVSNLHWTYWTLNTGTYGVLGPAYTGLASAKKEYSFLCFIQQGLLAVPAGSTAGRCGSTGMLPAPDGGIAPPPPAAVPAAPGNLAASAGDGRVTLTWSPVAGAVSYAVKSGTGGEVFDVVQPATTATTFTHTGLVNGVAYTYMVTASNTAGESAGSNLSSATPAPPPPSAPAGLTAVAGNAQVQLAWTPVAGATSYAVKFSTTSGGPYQTATAGLSSASFTHTGRTNGTTYYYVVTATNAGGESVNSGQVAAKPARTRKR